MTDLGVHIASELPLPLMAKSSFFAYEPLPTDTHERDAEIAQRVLDYQFIFNLVRSMTKPNPQERISATQALAQLQDNIRTNHPALIAELGITAET